MATSKYSDEIIERMAATIRNPRAMVGLSLDMLSDMTQGKVSLVEASNPFTLSLEMAATMASSSLLQTEAGMRRLYPSMAKTDMDAYLHMADEDYIGRFALPSRTTIGILLSLDEVMAGAAPVNDGSGAKCIKIPKHTTFSAGNFTCMLMYPLIIKILSSGRIATYLDTQEEVPGYIPATNIVKYLKSRMSDNHERILIDVPALQCNVSSNNLQLTGYTGYSTSVPFNDLFYMARAYNRDSDGAWEEIRVTHQDQVYDPEVPTLCVKVLNNSIEFYVPQIYFQNGTIKGSLRIDTYTTKGPMVGDITDEQTTSMNVKLQDYDSGLDEYSAPVQAFGNGVMAIIRNQFVGGRVALPLEDMLRRLRTRAASLGTLPITDNQLSTSLEDLGFEMNVNIDNITTRQYTAIRDLPPPEDLTTVTGLGCSIQLINFSGDEIANAHIHTSTYRRTTIKPSQLFVKGPGEISIVPTEEIERLMLLSKSHPESLCNQVNNTQYYFTPFHYVLDMSTTSLEVRPYIMSSPKLESRILFQQNDSMGLNLRSNSIRLDYVADKGYKLNIELEANPAIKQLPDGSVSMQLSYAIPGTSRRAWLSGTTSTSSDRDSGILIFEFDLYTDYDIDRDHRIYLTNNGGSPIDLTQTFDVIVLVKDYMPSNASKGDIDTIVSMSHVEGYNPTSTYVGVTQEKVTLTLGSFLSHLWRRSRTIIGAHEYRRYEKDVMLYWEEDRYQLDSTGTPVIDYDPVSGNIALNKIHSKGDPVLDPNGNHVVKHHKGHVMKDLNGEPIPATDIGKVLREVDMFLVDGMYYFASEEATINYFNSSLRRVVEWVTVTLPEVERKCLERTSIQFYPKSLNGFIDVIVGDGTMARVRADQSLKVTYVLSKVNSKNEEIVDNLRKITPSLLLTAFSQPRSINAGALTRNDIVSYLRDVLGSDIIDVRLSGFLGDEYQAVLLSSVSNVPAIGKKLMALSNLTLQVQDDIDISFEVLSSEPIGPYTLPNPGHHS